MKFKITATIPVGQYANIMPEIEVDAPDAGMARDEAFARLEEIWAQYGIVPLNKNSVPQASLKPTRKLIKAFVGGEIYYDDTTHIYDNENGEIYLSGSSYANQFRKPFDKFGIAKKMATKYSVDAKDIIDMWKLKGDVSRGFGTAMHSALELYGKYNGLATALEKDTATHDHPIIKKAVVDFYKGREEEKAEYEILIVDHEKKHAGQIDRLLITGDKRCRVQDYKTNADIKKDLAVYWKQLQFYADIMTAGGWTVDGTDIFHWDGGWHTYSEEKK